MKTISPTDYAAQKKEIDRAYHQNWSTCAPSTAIGTSIRNDLTYMSTKKGLVQYDPAPIVRYYPPRYPVLCGPKPEGWLRRFIKAWRAYEDWVAAETAKRRVW